MAQPNSSISQIVAASYSLVLAEMRKAANQWAESALMRELERQGGVKRESLGPSIECPLDFQRNPQTAFQTGELDPISLNATEVVSSASYTPAELSVPVVWSKKTEATNSSEQQKINLVKQLLENGINSHDDIIEEALFAASATNGFNSLVAMFPTSGQGTVGSIDSGTHTFWRHSEETYVDDTDIEAAMTTGWNEAAKGSGSSLQPSLIVSDGATQALFEGTQQANQRYVDTQDLKAGFKTLAFKSGRYVYSQYGTTSVFMFNPKSVFLVVSKEFFRDKGETQEIDNANGYSFKIYSALQLCTNNKSRVSVVHL